MNSKPTQLDELIHAERLPDSIHDTIEDIYRPIADVLSCLHSHNDGEPLVVGINGCQGSGKTTMTLFLQSLLATNAGLFSITLSLDDFYLGHQERQQLGDAVHHLLRTRGVPGTHDIDGLRKTISTLRKAEQNDATIYPRFDKSTDDRMPRENWNVVRGRPDIIFFEGWCVAAKPQEEAKLQLPRNEWEATHDPAGIWRTYVNEQLQSDYANLFSQIDSLIALYPPSFDVVFDWRREQEEKLRQKQGNASAGMSDEELREFISHYERLTVHMLSYLPAEAVVAVALNRDRSFGDMRIRP